MINILLAVLLLLALSFLISTMYKRKK